MGKFLTQFLVNNSGAAKRFTRKMLEEYISGSKDIEAKKRGELLKWTQTMHTVKTGIVLELPNPSNAYPTINALLAAVGVQILNLGPPVAALVAGDYRYKDMKTVLTRIVMAEDEEAPIVAAQPQRTPGIKENKNFSVDFLDKHAQPDLAKARAKALARFAGAPAPPVSQNFEKKSFGDFRNLIDLLAAKNFFETVEEHVAGLAPELLKASSSVSCVQYITQGQYELRTFTPAGPGALANDTPGAVAQYVQFALTRTSDRKLIVNHFTSPITATQPRPQAGDWHAVAFDDLVALRNNLNTIDAELRPGVYYLVGELALRTDL